MKTIFLIGAGKSTSFLILYLLEHAQTENWQLIVGDVSADIAQKKIGNHPQAKAVAFDVNNETERRNFIAQSDLVISMLPAHMHVPVAKDCLTYGKHLVTASYVSNEMQALDAEAKAKGVILLNEIGVDPGIDHLSAMQLVDKIKAEGGTIKLFESFTGGLVAPESDNNPWNYKFTWNPRNVVLAGQGGAVKFIQEGNYKYIPYHRLFRRTEIVEIEEWGKFEGYANRDSLRYRDLYDMHDIPTFYRGTFRRPGFCRAWDTFVQLGANDDTYTIEGSENMTYREFINLFLAYNPWDSVELKLMHYMKFDQDDAIMDKLRWLGIFERKKIGLKNATPAQILQKILEEKWSMQEDDKDMLVMFHKIGYEHQGKEKMIESSMVVLGDDALYTAMAKTVGLPMAIATRHILSGAISTPGVTVPLTAEYYTHLLPELEKYGVIFNEKEVPYKGY